MVENKKIFNFYYVIPFVTSLYNLFIFIFLGGKNISDYFSMSAQFSLIGIIMSVVSFALVIFSIILLIMMRNNLALKQYKFFPIYYIIRYILFIVLIPVILIYTSGSFETGLQKIDKLSNMDRFFDMFNLIFSGMMLYRLNKKKSN